MGVSGTGKSTVALELRDRLGWPYAEADEFHPAANVAKMASGHPLTDADRWPWLHALADWIRDHDARGESTVMTCSALRRAYRDILRGGGPGVFFVHLHGDKELLLQRMRHRQHFMPPELLDSQFATLENLEPDEPGMVIDVDQPVDRIVATVLARLDSATNRA